jgi:hypothetical protein
MAHRRDRHPTKARHRRALLRDLVDAHLLDHVAQTPLGPGDAP